MKHSFFLGLSLVFALSVPSIGHTAPYVVDYGKSTAGFAGTHADNEFKGTFKEWSATIDFDADNLTASTIEAEFVLGSASTGNAMYDGTLPQKDWFNSKEYPKGIFKSRTITHKSSDTYHIVGDLTLRNITQPVEFDFTLSDLAASPVIVKASFPIDRLTFEIGKKSDATAEWVSKDITITLHLTAQKQ